MPVRGDHEVPVIVRVLVHNHKIPLTAMQHKPLLVFVHMRRQAENAGIGLGTQDIFQPPRAPQLFHMISEAVSGSPVLPAGFRREKQTWHRAAVQKEARSEGLPEVVVCRCFLSILPMGLGQVFRVALPAKFFPVRRAHFALRRPRAAHMPFFFRQRELTRSTVGESAAHQ